MMKLLIVAASLAAAVPVSAQDAAHPVIAGYGAITPLPGAANAPDAATPPRAVFNIAKAAATPDAVNPGLDKVARYLNLLGSVGVRAAPGNLIVIIHGPATPLVLNEAAYRAKFAVPNANIELIAALEREGVEVHVCGQALTGHKISRDALNPAITVDLSAMTTLTKYQMKGWAFIPD